MVERLKAAIEKAREQRAGGGAGAPRPPAPARPVDWTALREITPSIPRMRRERIITYDKSHPGHAAFDVLRTRLLKLCRDRGWTRIGVTSPGKHCGKSVTCANLAFSVARHRDAAAVLLDLDLRLPRLAEIVGVRTDQRIASFLSGEVALNDSLARVGDRLAIGFNAHRERDAAEIMQSARTADTLERMRASLRPDLIIYDLPPLLVVDDAVGFLPNLDGVLLIAAAGQTRAREIADCERLIAEGSNFIGVVLNKQEDDVHDLYAYDYDHDAA